MFDITLVNEGGLPQPYSIDLPSWLTLSSRSGTIAPNTSITLKATVDNNLAIGNYNTILSLTTNYGFNRKIQLDLRVLEKEPLLSLDPSKFSQSMNIIGMVKLGGVFSNDLYDKVVAVVDGEVRGYASLIYDAAFKEYFVFLTVYSNKIGLLPRAHRPQQAAAPPDSRSTVHCPIASCSTAPRARAGLARAAMDGSARVCRIRHRRASGAYGKADILAVTLTEDCREHFAHQLHSRRARLQPLQCPSGAIR